MPIWNPWHGCTRVSPGCKNCYVYRRDAEFHRDASRINRTASFDLPVRRTRRGEYKLKDDGGCIYTCFTSDFFHEAADGWRPDAWKMMKERSDLTFLFITKRPERFFEGLPGDWGDGYENVFIGCTCENQRMTDLRLPVFLRLPIRHRLIIHEPMLGPIRIEKYLAEDPSLVEEVSCGGESGENARICDYSWILGTLMQCVKYEVPFSFHQTGARFRKGGRIYLLSRSEQLLQAAKANIDYQPNGGKKYDYQSESD